MIKRELTIASGLLASCVGSWACQPKNDELDKKLDAISNKIDELNKKVAQGAGRPQQPQQPMPQMPPEPNPTAIYAVPIDGAPVLGPKNAKVTIVEAFDFA
jgi:protein-disulfide isomerase